MKLTFLGTGTSTGVPQIGCGCEVCTSADPRDKRLRASALLTLDNGANILIDCGPDFRQQILREGSPKLACALITHEHYDHVGGVDDLRPYTHPDGFDIYCRPDVAEDLRQRVPYCFLQNPYPGVPQLNLREIAPDRPFSIPGVAEEVIPVPVMHWHLPIVGFRIGSFAYITDCKTMPESSFALLEGIDTLVINALRHEPHNSHLSLGEALALIHRIAPRRTFLTHFSHQIGLHRTLERTLPENVFPAFDGLQTEIP